MKITLTKNVAIAGVAHKKGEELEVTPQVAALLTDCTGSKAKKKAAKKEAPTSG